MPLISIITVTYNAEIFLPRTIKSIRNQRFLDMEYIIIDGMSSDGTLDIIQQNADIVTSYVSEKDRGLYDAMNKGLVMSKGEYVWFVNAGDEVGEGEVLSRIKEISVDNPDIIFGESLFLSADNEFLGTRSEVSSHKLPEVLDWQGYKYGMLVCHQAFIVRRSIASHYISNNLSADIDWEIKALKCSKKTVRYPGVLVYYLEGGISNRYLIRSLWDRYKVLRTHFGFWKNIKNHSIIVFRADYKRLWHLTKYFR